MDANVGTVALYSKRRLRRGGAYESALHGQRAGGSPHHLCGFQGRVEQRSVEEALRGPRGPVVFDVGSHPR